MAATIELLARHDHVSDTDFAEKLSNANNLRQDPVLVAHIVCMIIAYILIFPLGIALAARKSRIHVPMQLSGLLLAALGFIFGHTHVSNLSGGIAI